MDTRDPAPEGSGTTPALDPLRRVFIPVEKRASNGDWLFETSDGHTYRRGIDGVIRSRMPKINGKLAKRIRAKARAK